MDREDCRTNFTKKKAKNSLKSDIYYIMPNLSFYYQFGSVAQSVARLLCKWKVPGSNPAEGKVLFSRGTWNLARNWILALK